MTDALTNRPKRSEPRLVAMARRDLAERIADDWQGQNRTATDWEVILERADLPSMRHQNGYEAAKEIERLSSVRPDPELVEILDEGSSTLDSMHETAVRQWVKFHGHKLERSEGERVSTPWGEGTITRLEPDTCRYVVTPDDDPRFSSGGGWVVEAERCNPPVVQAA